jgi:hypothetical protein
LFGAILLLGAVASMWSCIRSAAAQHPEHVPTIVAGCVAASSLLIADASNPYLQAVGHGWGLALVVGIVNALLKPAEDHQHSGSGRPARQAFVPSSSPVYGRIQSPAPAPSTEPRHRRGPPPPR